MVVFGHWKSWLYTPLVSTCSLGDTLTHGKPVYNKYCLGYLSVTLSLCQFPSVCLPPSVHLSVYLTAECGCFARLHEMFYRFFLKHFLMTKPTIRSYINNTSAYKRRRSEWGRSRGVNWEAEHNCGWDHGIAGEGDGRDEAPIPAEKVWAGRECPKLKGGSLIRDGTEMGVWVVIKNV